MQVTEKLECADKRKSFGVYIDGHHTHGHRPLVYSRRRDDFLETRKPFLSAAGAAPWQLCAKLMNNRTAPLLA